MNHCAPNRVVEFIVFTVRVAEKLDPPRELSVSVYTDPGTPEVVSVKVKLSARHRQGRPRMRITTLTTRVVLDNP